jgi:predicted amidohydrolase YtcJ
MKKIILLVAVTIAVAGYLFLMKDFKNEKETIYYNGTILTMEDSNPVAGAVYVKDGLIAAVGSTDDIMKMKGVNTVLVDLDMKTMMPGFIDPHTHVDISAYLHDMIDLSGFRHKTDKEVWDYLENEIRKYPKGTWILCKGLDPILTADLKTPHISYLDKISPSNPLVILSQTLHSYWANTGAFQAAGISSQTPDPSDASYYARDKDGNLTGFIAEQEAFSPIREAMLKATPAKKMLQNFEATMRDYAVYGNTTVVSAGLTSDKKILVRLQEHLSSENPKILNQLLTAVGLFPRRSALPRHFVYMRYEMEDLIPASPDNGDDFFKVIGIKIWYDGSPYTGSMYLQEPYMDSELSRKELHIKPGHRGHSLLNKDQLVEIISKYNNEKWQIAIHAQGDSANAEVLDAFETVSKTMDITPYRHRIEHCLLLDKEGLQLMKQLNMSPSFHINHIYYYGKALSDSIIGPERANIVLPVKSAAKLNIQYSLHADQPMFDSNPFSLIGTAVTRKTREGLILGADEAISVTDALKSLTIMSAWQIGFEDKLGSIKTGKYADLVILDRNPLEVPAQELRDIRVLKTIVNGNNVSH